MLAFKRSNNALVSASMLRTRMKNTMITQYFALQYRQLFPTLFQCPWAYCIGAAWEKVAVK